MKMKKLNIKSVRRRARRSADNTKINFNTGDAQESEQGFDRTNQTAYVSAIQTDIKDISKLLQRDYRRYAGTEV